MRALLDAELFIKYGSPDRALKRLKTALEHNPRSIPLRERMREVAASHKHPEEAAHHCLALASLYIERDDFDSAHDRLLEAKQLDNRISIATGLDAIPRARHPELQAKPAAKSEPQPARPEVTFAGDLATISVFDAIQAIENSRLTGVLVLTNNAQAGRVLFTTDKSSGPKAVSLRSTKHFARSSRSPAALSIFKSLSSLFP